MFDDINDRKEKIRKNRAVSLLMPFLRGVLIYVIYAAMLALSMPTIDFYFLQYAQESLNFPVAVKFLFVTLFVYLFLNTVILTFSIYYRAEREQFLEKNHTQGFDKEEERLNLLHSRAFWQEFLTLTICFLLFPTLAGYDRVFPLLKSAYSFHPILQKLILTLVFALVSFGLMLKNRLEVREMWLELPSKMIKTRLWEALAKKKERKYNIGRMVLRTVGYTIIYQFEIMLLAFLVPFAVSVVKILLLIFKAGRYWGLIVLFALPIIYYWIAFRRRKKFVKALRALCRAYEFELLDFKHPYLSLFHDFKTYTFAIKTPKKTYYCRILGGIRKSNNMYLSEDGTCTRSFGIHMPIQRMANAGPFVQVHVRGENEDWELFRIMSSSNYFFEADGEKILLINPVPRKVFAKANGQSVYEMDNGDKIGDYTVYTGNAFLRSLERKDTY